MDAKEYFFNELPKRCGVHSAFGKVAQIIYEAERNGEKAFSRHNFNAVKERARLALPYKPAPGHEEEWYHGLDVATYFFLESDLSRGITIDKALHQFVQDQTYDDIELSVIAQASEWWNV